MKIPVAFLVFNRPETTQQVFEVIRQAKPPKLLVVADGPRAARPEDIEKCGAVRAIIETVDWNCKVLTNYSNINLGCKKRVSSGLDWVFEQVEEAIILEDDCLQDPTFFLFCEELLDKYREDKRIMVISGNNFQFGRERTEFSYYFSRHCHIWGWATWKRAWSLYDEEMNFWREMQRNPSLNNYLYDVFDNTLSVRYWDFKLKQTYQEKLDSWAYRWMLSCWIQNGLIILPSINLVSNIGFDNFNSTHTKNIISPFARIPTVSMDFPLKHPPFIIRNIKADKFTQTIQFGVISRIIIKIINILLLLIKRAESLIKN